MTMPDTCVQRRRRCSPRALLVVLLGLAAAAPAFAAGTLDRARETARLTIGYTGDMRPFAYAEASGKPAGYAIELCSRIGEAVKRELKLPVLSVAFVALSREEAFRAVEQGKADLLCGAVPTLERRAIVDFSIPIMLSGTGVAVRADAPARLVQVLSGRQPTDRQVVWRASLDQAPQRGVLAVPGGTTLEKELLDQLKERRIVAEVLPVKDTDTGLQMLAEGKADAFFSDRALLMDAAARSRSRDVIVLDRLFRRDLVALAMRRNDDDFRLLVDRTLSRSIRTGDAVSLYASHFGTPTGATLDFFQLVALPD
jgi:ABC-type amino acid transport substrate-binding protein